MFFVFIFDFDSLHELFKKLFETTRISKLKIRGFHFLYLILYSMLFTLYSILYVLLFVVTTVAAVVLFPSRFLPFSLSWNSSVPTAKFIISQTSRIKNQDVT